MKISPKYLVLAFLLIAVLSFPTIHTNAEESSSTANRANSILGTTNSQLSGRCPICGDFLYKHNNIEYPDFQCLPQGGDRRGIPEHRKMVCPVCNSIIDVEFVKQLDSSGGIDSDFCFHSLKPSDYSTNIYTCTNCGYSAFADGFYELPTARKVVDAELEKIIDRHFRLAPSFVSWVRSTLAKEIHGKLNVLARKILPDADWKSITTQASIPIDMKLDALVRCYSKRGLDPEFFAGLYQRIYFIYRNKFCKASVTQELQRGYILTLPLLFKPADKDFKNEADVLEDLGKLKHGELAFTLGIKWADYTTEELIKKFFDVIILINQLLDGSANEEDTNRAKIWKVTLDNLYCAKFVLFLELASCYLRVGELSLAQKTLEKAQILNESGKLFTAYPDSVPEGSTKITKKTAIKRTNEVILLKYRYYLNHLKFMVDTLELMKDMLTKNALRAVYYPTHTYLIGNLYYRLGNYKVAKVWFGMAKKTAVIYQFLGLPQVTKRGFDSLVDAMAKDPMIINAEDLNQYNFVDVEYLNIIKDKIEEYDLARKSLTARPQECRDFLSYMWKVFSRYHVDNGTFPPSLETLVRMGLLDAESNNNFKCPVSGKKYGYTPPSRIRPNTIYPLIYDEYVHDDDSGILGYILYSDGTIKHIASRATLPEIGPIQE